MNIPKYIELYRKELERKGYRQNSIDNYVSCVSGFLVKFKYKKDHEHINEQDIKDYLYSFKTQNTQRAVHSAIKCFYKYVCKQPNKFKYIEYCKRSRKLPIVHSQEEIQMLLISCNNLKHKAIISVIYACGLRVSEVINLEIADIDSHRMIINIRNAKGGKDRQVCLPEKLLILLRKYYIQYKPKRFLFNGQNSLQYSERSIAQFLKRYSRLAKLNKRIYPHLLRHDSFTHLLEGGCDISLIQKLAGHAHPSTTQLYTHISHNLISKINSPINQIII